MLAITDKIASPKVAAWRVTIIPRAAIRGGLHIRIIQPGVVEGVLFIVGRGAVQLHSETVDVHILILQRQGRERSGHFGWRLGPGAGRR